MRRRAVLLALALAFLAASPLDAKPPKEKGVPPGLAKKGGVPPGQAKRGTLPPGLAKKYGAVRPAKVYVAFDPRYDDRAWFLIGNEWVERTGFETSIRAEVRASLTLPPPPAPPPIPLPKVGVELRVVLFE